MNTTNPDIENSDSGWKTVSVHDKKYSIRAVEFDGGLTISLTDLIEIWTERLDRPAILKKCEELNPSLSIEDIDVYEFVRRLLVDLPKHATKVSAARIELSSELEGGIFYFAVDLTRGSAQQLWEEVTMPMCLAAGELLRRHNILLELVKAKDEEISEYKLNGAELIRKHIETEPFCNNLFEKNIPTQNIDSCQATFQAIVELRREVKMERFSIKTERMEKCFPENLVQAAISSVESAKNERSISKRYRHTLTCVDGPARKKRRRCVECYRRQRLSGLSATDAASSTNSAEPTDTQEASVIIEAEEKPTLAGIDLVSDGGGSSKFEGKSTSPVRESKTVILKVETNGSPKLTKASRASIEIHKDACDVPKRPRTTRSSPAKRSKKTIHDFIT